MNRDSVTGENPDSEGCDLCGASFSGSTLSFRHSTYRECSGCRSWTRLSAGEIQRQREVFREDYGDRETVSEAASKRSALWPPLLARIEQAAVFPPEIVPRKPRLLDVGCGYGDFLLAARERGWDVRGVEINPTMRGICLERGLTVSEAPLGKTDPWPGGVDAIAYWNVLDFLDRPAVELSAAWKALIPGGTIWIRTPNGAFHRTALNALSAWPSLLEKYLALDLSPLNARLYTPVGLKRLLDRVGFEEVGVSNSTVEHRGPFTRVLGAGARILEIASGGRSPVSTSLNASARKPRF